jgi:hypothetical protein
VVVAAAPTPHLQRITNDNPYCFEPFGLDSCALRFQPKSMALAQISTRKSIDAELTIKDRKADF